MESFSSRAYQHMKAPHGVGELASANVSGRAGVEGQGPFFVIQLQIAQERVMAAAFRTIACPWANAIGSVATEWVEGRSLDEAEALSPTVIDEALGGVPRSKQNLMGLALAAFQEALKAARCNSLVTADSGGM